MSNTKDLGLPRLPEVSEYQQEMMNVPKDAIYGAISAIELALGYMPQVQTEVPEWKKLLQIHVAKMQCSLEQLKRLR